METVKVMISLPRRLLDVVDRAASEEHRSRSEFLREAARWYLEQRAAPRTPLDDPAVRQAVAMMDHLAERDRPASGWDAVEAVRHSRQRWDGS